MKKESKQTKSCRKSPLINVTRLQLVNSLVMLNQHLILSKVGMYKIFKTKMKFLFQQFQMKTSEMRIDTMFSIILKGKMNSLTE